MPQLASRPGPPPVPAYLPPSHPYAERLAEVGQSESDEVVKQGAATIILAVTAHDPSAAASTLNRHMVVPYQLSTAVAAAVDSAATLVVTSIAECVKAAREANDAAETAIDRRRILPDAVPVPSDNRLGTAAEGARLTAAANRRQLSALEVEAVTREVLDNDTEHARKPMPVSTARVVAAAEVGIEAPSLSRIFGLTTPADVSDLLRWLAFACFTAALFKFALLALTVGRAWGDYRDRRRAGRLLNTLAAVTSSQGSELAGRAPTDDELTALRRAALTKVGLYLTGAALVCALVAVRLSTWAARLDGVGTFLAAANGVAVGFILFGLHASMLWSGSRGNGLRDRLLAHRKSDAAATATDHELGATADEQLQQARHHTELGEQLDHSYDEVIAEELRRMGRAVLLACAVLSISPVPEIDYSSVIQISRAQVDHLSGKITEQAVRSRELAAGNVSSLPPNTAAVSPLLPGTPAVVPNYHQIGHILPQGHSFPGSARGVRP